MAPTPEGLESVLTKHKKKKKKEGKKTEGEMKKRKQGGEGENQLKKKMRTERGNDPQTEEKSQTHRPTKSKKQTQEENSAELGEEVEGFDLSLMEVDTELSEGDLINLEEFVPNIRSRSSGVQQKLKRYNLQRFKLFKQQGLKLRWGKYTEKENDQIRRNVEDFLKLTGISSPEELFFPQRFPDTQKNVLTLRSQYRFYVKLAEGLVRTCELVYCHAKKMFDQQNHQGRFTDEENQTLEKLHTIHGNDWRIIGQKMDRSIHACQKRYVCMSGARGPWTEEENMLFLKAMKKQMKQVLRSSSNPEVGPTLFEMCSKLPWTRVSRKVGTRTWHQCRIKWFVYLRSRLKAVEPRLQRPDSTNQTRIRLIQALYDLNVDDAADVDWIQLAETVGGVTPVCVQSLFHRLKVSRIPNWSQRSFGDIVDHLFEKEVPRLLRKCRQRTQLDPVQISLDHLFPKDKFREVDNTRS